VPFSSYWSQLPEGTADEATVSAALSFAFPAGISGPLQALAKSAADRVAINGKCNDLYIFSLLLLFDHELRDGCSIVEPFALGNKTIID
jgi:hypothetical protein